MSHLCIMFAEEMKQPLQKSKASETFISAVESVIC